jgi:hypothetical protein
MPEILQWRFLFLPTSEEDEVSHGGVIQAKEQLFSDGPGTDFSEDLDLRAARQGSKHHQPPTDSRTTRICSLLCLWRSAYTLLSLRSSFSIPIPFTLRHEFLARFLHHDLNI